MVVSVQRDVPGAILDATEHLLARFGYRKMTVEEIAREAGIGKGSIYLHFSSKEEVVLSHVDRIIQRLNEQLQEICRSEGSAAERLGEMLLTRVLFRFDSVQHYRQSLNDLLAEVRPNLLARRAKYFEAEAQVFAELLEAGCQSGEFACADPLATAYGVLDATNSLLPYSLSPKELGQRDEVRKRTLAVTNLLLRGLLNTESETS